MRLALAFTFLAVARAAFIEVPKTIVDDGFKFIDPTWTPRMFAHYGLTKPLFDDFSTWGKSIGVENPVVLNDLHSFYDKPALVFFRDPTGRVLSYYAHEGIDKPSVIPEIKSAFHGLYGASDKIAINFQPDHLLGSYRSVLPGHFFEPVRSHGIHSLFNDVPVTNDHVTFSPYKVLPKNMDFWRKFDVEDLPMIYKDPVALDFNQKYLSEGFVPYTHTGFSDVSAAVPFGYGPRGDIIPAASHFVSGIPFTGFSDAVPFEYGRSGVFPKSSYFVSGTPFGYGRSDAYHLVSGTPFPGFRSALGVDPAVKSSAYHLVKADLPYFTAAPVSTDFLKTEVPVHGFHASPATTHYVDTATPLLHPARAYHAGSGFFPYKSAF